MTHFMTHEFNGHHDQRRKHLMIYAVHAPSMLSMLHMLSILESNAIGEQTFVLCTLGHNTTL
jgi:hypothetical protein